MACGRGKGRARGAGEGAGTAAVVVLLGVVIVLFVLGLTKFIVGLVFLNDCPAESKIPKTMSGSGGASSVIDVIVGCVEACTGGAEAGVLGVVGLMIQHLIGIIVGIYYVFHNYSYIIGGCDGAVECCDQNFIKFALGVSVIELTLVLIIIVVVLLVLCIQ